MGFPWVRQLWVLWLVLLVCTAPVLASYGAYYVWRPEAAMVTGDLIDPQRPVPAFLVGQDRFGARVPLGALQRQWLLVSVTQGPCDVQCERHLYWQRQLRESLGKDKGRLDWVWLRTQDTALPPAIAQATAAATVLTVPEEALGQWLAPAAGHRLSDHLYVVDPMGHWMLRFPSDAPPAKMRRDLQRLLQASAFWDREGR